MYTQTDVAWAAGFFDGEGCVTITWRRQTQRGPLKQVSPLLIASVVNVDPGAIERLHSLFGGAVRSYQHHANGHTIYEWRATGSKGSNFLSAVLPYSITKRTQIEVGLRFAAERPGRGKARTAEQHTKDVTYYHALKQLKVVS